MKFFSDTNIPLAFSVIHDKWHEISSEFINTHEKNLIWSNLVKKEYQCKLENIIDDFDIFFNFSKDILKKNQRDFSSYYEFEKFMMYHTKKCSLDEIKKRKLLKDFWDKFDFYEGISEVIYDKFNTFTRNFEKIYYTQDKKLDSIMRSHNCGLKNYLKYKNYALKLESWGVHSPDCKIVVDAHDCGKSHIDLIFCTIDKELWESISTRDTSFLNIKEFRLLSN